jgi:hypothetical protein
MYWTGTWPDGELKLLLKVSSGEKENLQLALK